jgi:signal peptidase I
VEGRDGHVVVDGKELKESYLPDGVQTGSFGPVTITPDHYWVMGDNRPNSSDSRVFGAIPESLIIGRAFVKVWPLGSFRFF